MSSPKSPPLETSTGRTPFFQSTGSGALYGWHHKPPDNLPSKGIGVVLCPPLGFEQIHAHRAYRRWAESFAEGGFHAVRFDYRHTGNSSGDGPAASCVSSYLADILSIADKLLSQGRKGVAFVGCRFGATLAVLAAKERPSSMLILWNPITSGRRYARELRAIAAMSAAHQLPASNTVECAGFEITSTSMDEIATLEIKNTDLKNVLNTLLIDDNIKSKLGGTEGIEKLPSVDDSSVEMILREPHNTQVPRVLFRQTCDWLNDKCAEQNSLNSNLKPFALQYSAKLDAATSDSAESIEIIRNIPHLVGIHNRCKGVYEQSTFVILLNAGSVHSAGPNRLYCQISRALANVGISSLRLDLRNLGDSPQGAVEDENHPYPATATEDVAIAVNWAKQRHPNSKIILMGLCSGAHSSLHAALSGLDINQIILINPLTFRWHDGLSLDQGADQNIEKDRRQFLVLLKNPKTWLKNLLTYEKLAKFVKFFFKFSRSLVSRTAVSSLRFIGLIKPSQLSADLDSLASRSVAITLVFSSGDPGWSILTKEAGSTASRLVDSGNISVHFIEEADHTFTLSRSRHQLIAVLQQEILQ